MNNDKQQPLKGIQKRVYDALPLGLANAIKADALAKKLKITPRKLYAVISSLVNNGYLVGSYRNQRGGLFRISNRGEFDYTVNMLKKTARAFNKRADALLEHENRFK